MLEPPEKEARYQSHLWPVAGAVTEIGAKGSSLSQAPQHSAQL